MFKKVLSSLILISSLALIAMAQHVGTYSQYMFNGLVINPAYTGTSDYLNATLITRQQWLGVKGAPSTQSLSVHTPIPDKKIAVGAIFINDKIGVTTRQEIALTYAYHLEIPEGKLSLGLQAGLSNFFANYSDLELESPEDPHFQDERRILNVPNFGFGAYYYTPEYYIGFSAPQMVSNVFIRNIDAETKKSIFKNHYFLTGGYLFNVDETWKIKPSILFKLVDNDILEFDINTNVYYHENVCIGLSYRSLSSVNFILEVGLDKAVRLGYSVDIPTNESGRLSIGTHEISINYIFDHKKLKNITPWLF